MPNDQEALSRDEQDAAAALLLLPGVASITRVLELVQKERPGLFCDVAEILGYELRPLPQDGMVPLTAGEGAPQIAEQARLVIEEHHLPPLKRTDPAPTLWRLSHEGLQQLAELVRLQRTALRLSHCTAGARCGLSDSTMKNIEKASHFPSEETIRKLAKLEIDVTPFLRPTGT